MYELVQVSENCHYMDCPAKVGFVRVSGEDVVLIDSGSDKDAAKKVKKHIDAMHWNLKAIFNTHAHADHIGGNAHLQGATNCKVFCPGVEAAFANHPYLEGAFLYGSLPMHELENKFLLAKESNAEPITDAALPDGMTVLPLPGHSYAMAGFRSKDNVLYVADSVVSEETLNKYQIAYVYDVEKSMETLKMLQTVQADCFVPAHAPAMQDIAPLAKMNLEKTIEIADKIEGMLSEKSTFEDLLAKTFDAFSLTMTLQQRVLVGTSVKAYLTYLHHAGRIGFDFADNKMLWQKI